MSFPKTLLIGSLSIFALIGVMAVFKKESKQTATSVETVVSPAISAQANEITSVSEPQLIQPILDESEESMLINRVPLLFTTGPRKLPIVETITYQSRVPWLKGRPAWVADYASHFKTSRHFIARSLNGKPDYVNQKVGYGKRFNVLAPDRNLEFYLLIDLSRCKMRFYYIDLDANERVLLKTYSIGLGRMDVDTTSTLLTPQGKYRLGDKITTYKPGDRGFFQEQDIEMIQVFGTRWIPFNKALTEESEEPYGLGFHGAPWIYDEETDSYREDRECVGTYDSDGCVRLLQEDIEELYAIVVTKPTTVEITKDWSTVELPGAESIKYPDNPDES